MLSLLTFTIGAITGYCICLYRKELVGLTKQMFQKTRSALGESHSKTNVSSNYDIEIAKVEFLKITDKFTGVYESLYAVAHQKAVRPDEVINDWSNRIQHLSQASNFQRLWLECKEQPLKIIDFFKGCGVERDNRKTLVADQLTRYMYFTDTDMPEIGATYEILFPCWYIGETVLEKGIIKLRS